jgi:ABC-type transport system substrate-binding protein
MIGRPPRIFPLASALLLILLIVASVAKPVSASRHSALPSKQSLSKSSRCKGRNKPAGTIRFSSWQFPDTLNPYQSSRLVTREVTNALFDSLFQYNNQATLIPQMAETIPTLQNGGIRDGGKTIMIQLKKGLRWSNGAEITSADVRFGWKLGMDSATGPSCLGGCDIIYRIDTPHRYRAVLHLKRPYSSAVPNAMPDVWPNVWSGAWRNNPHAAALKLGQDARFNFESSRFPTDGAYRVSQFEAGGRITLQPMKYYTDMVCGGLIKNLIFTSYHSKAGLIDAAAGKKTDVTTDYNRSDVPQLSKHRDYRVHVRTSFTFEHLEFNIDKNYRGKRNPLFSKNVRVALSLALDKYALIRNALAVKNPSRVAAWTPFVSAPDLRQPLVPGNPSGQWDPIARKYVTSGTARAVSDARKILNQSKFKRGFSLDFYTTLGSGLRLAEEAVVASSWSKLKVSIVPNYLPDTKLLGPWSNGGIAAHGSFQVAMFAYVGSPDADQLKYNLESRYCDRRDRIHSTINGNNSCIQDGLIDKSFSRAAGSFKARVRSTSYSSVATEVNRQAYWVPLYFRPTVSTEDGRVVNFSDNPTVLGPTWNIYAWRARK